MKGKLAILIVIVLAAGGFAAHKLRGKNDSADQARVIEAEEGPIADIVEATGAIEPLNRVEVRPPVAGRIEELLVEEGDRVKEGQIIAWMSSTDRAAVLDAARAKGPEEFARWQDSYKPTPVVAPLTGDVILRNVVVGESVGTGTVLYAISDRLIITASVDESDIGRVKTGMRAEITLDAYPDKTVPGKVFRILFEGKNVSNVITYKVKIQPDTTPRRFRSQMTANLKLIVAKRERAVLLPSIAVREGRRGGRSVQVPGPDGEPVLREVEIGLESGETVEIVSGLQAGDKVVIASKRYRPQAAAQSSPLAFGGRGRAGRTQQSGGSGGTPRRRGQ